MFFVLDFTISTQMLPVIEYQYHLTDTYNPISSREKHLCQNYVYLSPEIYVRSFVSVHRDVFVRFLGTI